MPTTLEALGIDRMTVAERKALVREIWATLPEEERTLPAAPTPVEASPRNASRPKRRRSGSGTSFHAMNSSGY